MKSYTKLLCGEAKFIVATEAFVIRINKHNIWHVIHDAVESIVALTEKMANVLQL